MDGLDGSAVSATGLAIAGAVASQALVPRKGWETPLGFEVTASAGVGLATIAASTRAKKKKTKRRLLFAGIGMVAGDAAVQTYKMGVNVFEDVAMLADLGEGAEDVDA